MNKMKLAVSLTAIAGALSLPAAYADPSLSCGWYLEATVGTSKLQDVNYPPGISTKSTGLAANGSIGYKFMPYVAAEVGYTYYGIQRISGGGTTLLKNRPYDFHADLKGIIPIANSGFEPFAKVGVGRLKTRYQVEDPNAFGGAANQFSDKAATGVYLGAGVQYYFYPEFAVVAEWARAKGNDSTGTLDIFSIGMSYIFDY